MRVEEGNAMLGGSEKEGRVWIERFGSGSGRTGPIKGSSG